MRRCPGDPDLVEVEGRARQPILPGNDFETLHLVPVEQALRVVPLALVPRAALLETLQRDRHVLPLARPTAVLPTQRVANPPRVVVRPCFGVHEANLDGGVGSVAPDPHVQRVAVTHQVGEVARRFEPHANVVVAGEAFDVQAGVAVVRILRPVKIDGSFRDPRVFDEPGRQTVVVDVETRGVRV